jgi:hypothetical protein
MRALVIYESLWGNTEQIAREIATELESTMTVETADSDSAPASVDGFDLLVVGAPTHAFSMSRPSTRQQAGDQRNAPHVPARGIREWLGTLNRPNTAITAIAFDTRVNKPRLPGSAAKAIRQELRSLGFSTPVKAETFRVNDYEGPLIDGELTRAAAWIRRAVAGKGESRAG